MTPKILIGPGTILMSILHIEVQESHTTTFIFNPDIV